MKRAIMIGLAKELSENGEEYELHRLLGALLSKKLSAEEKLNIIENEYDISIKESFRRDVSEMCNLGQGVLDMVSAAERLGISIEEFERCMKESAN